MPTKYTQNIYWELFFPTQSGHRDKIKRKTHDEKKILSNYPHIGMQSFQLILSESKKQRFNSAAQSQNQLHRKNLRWKKCKKQIVIFKEKSVNYDVLLNHQL